MLYMLVPFSSGYYPVDDAMKGYGPTEVLLLATRVPRSGRCAVARARSLVLTAALRAAPCGAGQPYYHAHLPQPGFDNESVVVSHPIVMDPTEVFVPHLPLCSPSPPPVVVCAARATARLAEKRQRRLVTRARAPERACAAPWCRMWEHAGGSTLVCGGRCTATARRKMCAAV